MKLAEASTALKCSDALCKDKNFMEVVEIVTPKKNGHYVVHYTFIMQIKFLPNNKKQVI